MISITIDIPEPLFEALTQHVEQRPEWNSNRVGTAALALFLMQSGIDNRGVAVTYLNSIFDWRGEGDERS